MTNSYKNNDDENIVFPTPKDTTIIRVDDNSADQIGELVESALLRRETPFTEHGEAVALILVRQGGGPGGG